MQTLSTYLRHRCLRLINVWGVDKSWFLHLICGLFQFLSKDQLHYRSAQTKELDSMLGDLHCDTLGLFFLTSVDLWINCTKPLQCLLNLYLIMLSPPPDLEMVVMRNLQTSVLQRSFCLYKVMSLCAELDCLIALAQASLDHGYCCPTLTSNHRLALIESRCKSSLLMRYIFWFLCSSVYIFIPLSCSAILCWSCVLQYLCQTPTSARKLKAKWKLLQDQIPPARASI